MFGRLKSSLEKRAPGVVGALRNLRGSEPEPAAPKPVVPAKPVVAAPDIGALPPPGWSSRCTSSTSLRSR